MTQITLPTFADLSQALENATLHLHASEAHGLVSGIIAANSASARWEDLVMGGDEKSDARELLQALHDGSAQQLKDFLFEFQLLLPAEDEALPVRAEALSLWCMGFLTGLKASGAAVNERETGEAAEAMADLLEVAKMDYQEVVDNDEDEEAYLELVEYVRMAVIFIYQALQEQETANAPKHTSSHLH